MDERKRETYLGDGLYARDDGFHFWLRAERGGDDHEVALDGTTLDEFLRYIERARGVKITIQRA